MSTRLGRRGSVHRKISSGICGWALVGGAGRVCAGLDRPAGRERRGRGGRGGRGGGSASAAGGRGGGGRFRQWNTGGGGGGGGPPAVAAAVVEAVRAGARRQRQR